MAKSAAARKPREYPVLAMSARNGLRIFDGPLIKRLSDKNAVDTLATPANLQTTVSTIRGVLGDVQWDALLPIITWATQLPNEFQELIEKFKAIPEGNELTPKVQPFSDCLLIVASVIDRFPRKQVMGMQVDPAHVWHNHFARLGDGKLIKTFQDLVQYAPTLIAIMRLLGVPVPDLLGLLG